MSIRPAATPRVTLDAVSELRVMVAALTRRVEALESGRGPRDAQDQALVLALATSTKGLDFGCAALWRHRDVDRDLAEALENADNPQQLGKLLARLAGHHIGGWRIARVGTDRSGLRWQLQVCESETYER